MRKVLFVSGDDDYGALSFEQSNIVGIDAWNKATANGGSYEGEHDGNTFTVEALEFGDIDEKFNAFLQLRVMDYDAQKHTNYYLLPIEGLI